MSGCPVIVYRAPDVPVEAFVGEYCPDCFLDLTEHEQVERDSVKPGMAFFVNPDRMWTSA